MKILDKIKISYFLFAVSIFFITPAASAASIKIGKISVTPAVKRHLKKYATQIAGSPPIASAFTPLISSLCVYTIRGGSANRFITAYILSNSIDIIHYPQLARRYGKKRVAEMQDIVYLLKDEGVLYFLRRSLHGARYVYLSYGCTYNPGRHVTSAMMEVLSSALGIFLNS